MRKNLFQAIVFSTLLLVVAAGCAEGPVDGERDDLTKGVKEASVEGEKIITLADDGKTIVLKVDDLLEIQLDANESTPFHWTGPFASADSLIRVVSNEYIQDPAPAGVTGSGGTRVYQIAALKSGTVELTWNESESAEEVSQTFKVTLEISE